MKVSILAIAIASFIVGGSKIQTQQFAEPMIDIEVIPITSTAYRA